MMRRNKLAGWLCLGIMVLPLCAGAVTTRVYRQIKDVSVRESGAVAQSRKKADLFEFTYVIDKKNKTITRSHIRRLDENLPREDRTQYTIMAVREVVGSDFGNGGKAIVAVRKDGQELLELGHRFAYTMRTSPFSQVITGVYKRVPSARPGACRKSAPPVRD